MGEAGPAGMKRYLYRTPWGGWCQRSIAEPITRLGCSLGDDLSCAGL